MPTRSVRYLAPLAIVVAAAPALSATVDRDRQAIVAAMEDSAAGWNAGDMARFMAVYSSAPTASFTTSRGVVRGRPAMEETYRRTYDFSNLDKRGRLAFEALDFRRLGAGHALYVARFSLSYPGGKSVTGVTSLVFARERGGWKVIADHSS